MYTKGFSLFFIIFYFSSTYNIYGQTTSDHTITIFVHGTFPARKILQYIPGGRSLIYCPQGLSLAKDFPSTYHFHKMAQGCVDCNPKQYTFDQFYIFGWKSEHVYHETRMQAAKTLVQELQDLVLNYYKKYDVIPSLRLIGFSHGGNVVVNTANFLPLYIQDTPVHVEIWLFGTPVQKINQNSINSKNFNKVYSIYSEKDWLQRMDPQGLRNKKYRKDGFWSNRMFDNQDSCIQVKFTVNNKSISHSYYRCIFKYFAEIEQLIKIKSENINSGSIAINLNI